MNSIQRIHAVINRQLPDHPPVSFWCHFPAGQVYGPAAVAAHLQHLDNYDLDFLKVMNDNGYPHHAPVEKIPDLAGVSELRGDEAEFGRQLDLLADLRRQLRGRVLMITTIFSSWATLRQLIRPPTAHNPPDLSGAADAPSQRIKQFMAQDELAVKVALRNLGTSLANFAARCLAAGANGIFLSVRDDWVDGEGDGGKRYAQLVGEQDRQILHAAGGAAFNVLHACGRPVNFRDLAEYPVHAINWADRAAGPAIAEVKDWLRPAICGGVDNLATLPNGSVADVEREVADALRQAGGRPMIISPGCTYDPARVPAENLRAMVRAARQFEYVRE
jgi:uroporphyrinogen decarboxylase